MGMFDVVYLPLACPYCGYSTKEHDWQTKALENAMLYCRAGSKISFEELEVAEGNIKIYGCCPRCQKLIGAKVAINNSTLTDKITYKKA